MGLFSSIIGGISNIFTNKTNTANVHSTNATNLRIAHETNQLNQALAEQQNEWNLQQWNRENQYNDPSAQMQRLQAAGLSPAAAAAAITGNTASSLTSAQLANQQMPSPMVAPQSLAYNPMFDDLNEFKYKEAVTKGQELANQKQAIENGSLPDFIFSDLEAKKLEYQIRSQEFEHSAKMFPYSIEALKEDITSKRNNNELHPLVKRIQEATAKQMEYNFDWTKSTNLVNLRKSLQEADARIKASIASAASSNANAALANEQTNNAQKQGKILDLDAQAREFQNILTKFGAPQSTAERIGAMLAEKKIDFSDLFENLSGTKQYLQTGGNIFNSTKNKLGIPELQYQKFWYDVMTGTTSSGYNFRKVMESDELPFTLPIGK